jgi:3',5'-cyclic AMP phosphodiesterase CpdA
VAQAAEFQPFVFIHAGDTELGSPDLKGTTERLAHLAERANALGAAFVLITGDITHGSKPEELKAFHDTLPLFKMPVKVIPGNHDKLELFRKHFGDDRYVFTHGNCDFICLNTNLLSMPEGNAEEQAQWKWLEECLKESRQKNRTHLFVAMHHPLASVHRMDNLLAKYGVEVVLCGHLHTTEERHDKGYSVYITPGTAKFRDANGLGYRVFKVSKGRIEQQFIPVSKEATGPRAEP